MNMTDKSENSYPNDSNILLDITKLMQDIEMPCETGAYTNKAPNQYVVITPIYDDLELYGDDKPTCIIEEARISLFTKGNYLKAKNKILHKLIDDDFTVTDAHYIEFEEDTKYHHYNIDVEKHYEWR